MLLAFGRPLSAADVSYQVKASYLYNILQFVDFPAVLLKDQQVNLCVLGEDRFGRALAELEGASTPNGRVKVSRLGTFSPRVKLAACNLLYVVESERAHLDRIMAQTNQLEMVTVSELASFIDAGGLIELYHKDDNIRFKINAELAGRTEFRLHAQLVQLGVEVLDPEALRQSGKLVQTLIASLSPIRRSFRIFS